MKIPFKDAIDLKLGKNGVYEAVPEPVDYPPYIKELLYAGVGGAALEGAGGAALGALMPLTEGDYVEKPDRTPADPAWKWALLSALAAPIFGATDGNKSLPMAAIQALAGGLAGGAGGYAYGLTREHEGNKKLAAARMGKNYDDPLSAQ
jgi:hypothetical protein